jgi:hypothetical protein
MQTDGGLQRNKCNREVGGRESVERERECVFVFVCVCVCV